MVIPARELPDLPLLAPWYRLVEEGERLVLEHGHRTLALEGAAVGRLLPHLLPLLDGTRTVEEIVSAVGPASDTAVRKALALLTARGLLVDGPPADCGVELAETVDYLAAGTGLSPALVAGRIADARVGVVGAALAGEEAARILRRAGVPRIERRGWDEARSADDLDIVAPAPDEVAELFGWNASALAAGRRWLAVLPYDGRIAAVGPLYVPDETACYACYGLRRAAALALGGLSDLLDAVPIRAGGGPALAVVAGALAAVHALRWLGVRDAELPGTLYAIEGEGALTVTAHAVLRVPRCPACSSRTRAAAPLPWFQPATVEDCA